jgi:putative DNA primase/helicase
MPVSAHNHPEVMKALSAYAKLGWKMFPCNYAYPEGGDEFCGDMVCSCLRGKDCKTTGKHPMFTGYYDDATDNIGQLLRTWFIGGYQDTRKEDPAPANIGVITGKTSGFLVYDLDPKNGGNDSHEANVAAHGFPKTVTAKSGSGVGRHFFFKWDPRLDVLRPHMYTPYPGIDIFCGGTSLVVLPPSRHKSGNHYEWIEAPWDTELAGVPEWLIQDLLEVHAEEQKHTASSAGGKRTDLRATDWFEKDAGDRALSRAFDEYIAANTPRWPENNSPCPICGSETGFKISNKSDDRWVCHGGHHKTAMIGTVASDGSWTGDVIDFDAFQAGDYVVGQRNRSRVLYLKKQGYL